MVMFMWSNVISSNNCSLQYNHNYYYTNLYLRFHWIQFYLPIQNCCCPWTEYLIAVVMYLEPKTQQMVCDTLVTIDMLLSTDRNPH
jgi:hypothetical protein